MRSVHTREVIAIFALRSVHTRGRFGILHSSGRRMSGYPANQTCTELAFPVLLCFCTYAARGVHRRKWLGGHLAPPPNHDLEVRAPAFIQWFRWVICEIRNLKTPLDRHLKCAFQMTHRNIIWRTHGTKYCLSNFNSKCAFRSYYISTCKPNVCDYHSTMQQV